MHILSGHSLSSLDTHNCYCKLTEFMKSGVKEKV